jgi:opacity protein-like surface antigen
VLHKKLGLAAVAAICISLWAGTASADDFGGAYLGGSFGRARNEYDTNRFDAQFQSLASASSDKLTLTDRSVQRLSDVWWANAGYLFTPYIGVDAAFVHAGQLKYLSSGHIVEAGSTESARTTQELTSHGSALSLIGRLPLTDRFEVDLRVGDYLGKSSLNAQLYVDVRNAGAVTEKSTSSLLAGLGTAYSFGGHWSLRLDYLRINKTGSSEIGKYNVNIASAGVSFTF